MTVISDLNNTLIRRGLPTISLGSTQTLPSHIASQLGNDLLSLWTAAGGGTSPADVAALRAVLPAVNPAPAPAGAPYSTIYAFGDSLSDSGNDYILTAGQIPKAPYANGEFSNGPIWVQDLAQQLGLPAPGPSLKGGTDFAFGGAETGTTAVHTANPLDLPSQLGQFEAQVGTPQPNALYTLSIGGNDLFDATGAAATNPAAAQAAVGQAVANVDAFVLGLAGLGAKNFLILDAPDLGQTPQEQQAGAAQAATASSLSAEYNQQLTATLDQTAASHGLTIDLVDSYGLLDNAISNPAAYGFTNVRDPLWTGNLQGHNGTLQASGAAQSGYLFFDKEHPTAAGQADLATAAHAALAPTA